MGVTGLGVALDLVPDGPYTSLRFTTNATKPHLFRSTYANLYIEITTGPNAGRQFRIAKINDGTSLAAPNLAETAYLWTYPAVPATDAEFAGLTTGAIDFEWKILDWEDLGLSVVNTSYPVGGRYAFLDELSRARGRQRAPGEGDEQLRARLLRKPQLPSPLGVLRKAIVALAPFGVNRHDIRIYELGERGPDAVDLYAENFPAGGSFDHRSALDRHERSRDTRRDVLARPELHDARTLPTIPGLRSSATVSRRFSIWCGGIRQRACQAILSLRCGDRFGKPSKERPAGRVL